MENASKALLIAAGVLLAIIILTIAIGSYKNIQEYYNTEVNATKVEQITKFNSEYTAYDRNDVRGSDLLSLINKIVNNNERNEEKITIEIKISGDYIGEFYYKKGIENGINFNKLQDTIIQDEKLIINGPHILANAISNIKTKSGLSEKKLQLLTKNISNLFAEETEYNIIKRNDIIKEVFDISDKDIDNKIIEKAKTAALEYYQITQFKRAHFTCTNTEYNEITAKIAEMKFEFTGRFN